MLDVSTLTAEQLLLLAIPPSLSKKSRMTKIQRVATKAGVKYKVIYDRWLRLHKKNASDDTAKPVITAATPAETIIPIPAGKGKNIVAYVLEDGAVINRYSMLSGPAVEKLTPIVNSMEPFGAIVGGKMTRHTVPVNVSEKESIRKWLRDNFAPKVFGTTKIEGNDDMVRLFRKS